MEKFLVPQYIDVEPKIMGPITGRQFIEMLIGGFLSFIIYKTAPFNVAVVFGDSKPSNLKLRLAKQSNPGRFILSEF